MNLVHNKSTAASETTPSETLERVFELAVRLTDAMDRGLADRGLTRPRAELIWRLGLRSPMTQRELSEALRCTPRNVTDLVDALEAAGLVARGPHPTDRRATLVTLTRQGKAAVARMRAGYGELAVALFADVPAADLAAFVAVIDGALGRLREAGT